MRLGKTWCPHSETPPLESHQPRPAWGKPPLCPPLCETWKGCPDLGIAHDSKLHRTHHCQSQHPTQTCRAALRRAHTTADLYHDSQSYCPDLASHRSLPISPNGKKMKKDHAWWGSTDYSKIACLQQLHFAHWDDGQNLSTLSDPRNEGPPPSLCQNHLSTPQNQTISG